MLIARELIFALEGNESSCSCSPQKGNDYVDLPWRARADTEGQWLLEPGNEWHMIGICKKEERRKKNLFVVRKRRTPDKLLAKPTSLPKKGDSWRKKTSTGLCFLKVQLLEEVSY